MDNKPVDIWEILKGSGGVGAIIAGILAYLGLRQKNSIENKGVSSQVQTDQFTKVEAALWKIIEELKEDNKRAEDEATRKIEAIEKSLALESEKLRQDNSKLSRENLHMSEEITILRRHLRTLTVVITHKRQDVPENEINAIIELYQTERRKE